MGEAMTAPLPQRLYLAGEVAPTAFGKVFKHEYVITLEAEHIIMRAILDEIERETFDLEIQNLAQRALAATHDIGAPEPQTTAGKKP